MSLFLSAGDASEVWGRLYDRVDTLEQKYSIMQKIVQLDDPSMELTLTLALSQLVEGDLYNKHTGSTQDLWSDLTKMIIRELGDYKAQDAAPVVYIVMRDFSGLLKAEAMIALGSMQAVEYADEMSTVLRNLNFNVQEDKDTAEKEAFGAVMGLNRMGEMVGFEPVFYAHVGWYSRRIKEVAAQTLTEMVEDPTEEIMKILETASYEDKLVALDVENRSSASAENKIRTAVYALELGVSLQGADITENQQLAELRIAAMNILIENEASDESTISMLDRAYTEAPSLEEQLSSVLALAVNGSDAAVTKLIEYLEYFNERQASGLSPNNQEQQLIRQILYGLGISGNGELAMPALSAVEIFNYSNSINRSAKTALENYQ